MLRLDKQPCGLLRDGAALRKTPDQVVSIHTPCVSRESIAQLRHENSPVKKITGTQLSGGIMIPSPN